MPFLYTLHIAINEYHPNSIVRSLEGCIRDIDRMKVLLKRLYPQRPEDHTTALVNEQATYSNIIQAIRALSAKAISGDTILIQYSGHGSYNKSAEAFRRIDSKQQDETLVCYDSRLPGRYDLADKELGVLFSEFSEGVDIVFIADCCFSGTLTRSGGEEATSYRFTPGRRDEPRPLETYLDAWFTHQADGTVHVPERPHIVLSSCDRDQVAFEKFKHGLFTYHLLEILERSRGRITYADLFQRVRSKVAQSRVNRTPQTPTFEVVGYFNCNRYFLGAEAVHKNSFFVHHKDGAWQMEYGAVHGLHINPDDKAPISLSLTRVNAAPGREEPAIPATIEAVMMNYSRLNIEQPVPPKTQFWADVVSLPKPNLCFLLDGDIELQERFNELFLNTSPFFEIHHIPERCKYVIGLESRRILIRHRFTGQLIAGLEGAFESCVQDIGSLLVKIEHWERIAAVENPALPGEPELGLSVVLADGRVFQDKNIHLDYSGSNIPFRILANNATGRDLFIALIQLNRNYWIKSWLPGNTELKNAETDIELRHDQFLIAGDASESTVIFKLIASTQPIDTFLLEQEALPGFGKVESINRRRDTEQGAQNNGNGTKNSEYWFTQTVTVKIVRQAGTLDRGIHQGGLSLQPNPTLSGRVSIGTAGNYTRSVRGFDGISAKLKMQGLNLLALREQQPAAIHLLDLQTDASGRIDTPLELRLEPGLSGNNWVLPVAHDGEFILPFGQTQQEPDGGIAISIGQLPTLSESENTRSLGRALVFGLLKVGLGLEQTTFQLRVVDYDAEPARYISGATAVRARVASAQNICLVVHGLFGNTGEEADMLRSLYENGHFDLVLAFDYENLNTGVTEIALRLKDALDAVGLRHADGKHLTVVAHSLGGLVCRYWIENLAREEDTVNRLLLIGTPNRGTLWSKSATWANWLNVALAMALNGVSGPAGAVIQWVQRALAVVTPLAFTTLRDMAPFSELMQQLAGNNAPAHTKYFVLAGDAQALRSAESQGVFNRLLLKLGETAGDWIYANEASDLFATVESQRNLPFPVNTAIRAAHHFGYFGEAGKEWVKDVITKTEMP